MVSLETSEACIQRSEHEVRPLALSVKDAARCVGVPEMTLRDHMQRGEIAFVRYGRGRMKSRYVLLVEDLSAWLHRRRQPAEWEACDE